MSLSSLACTSKGFPLYRCTKKRFISQKSVNFSMCSGQLVMVLLKNGLCPHRPLLFRRNCGPRLKYPSYPVYLAFPLLFFPIKIFPQIQYSPNGYRNVSILFPANDNSVVCRSSHKIYKQNRCAVPLGFLSGSNRKSIWTRP